MSNQAGPFGFRASKRVDGADWNLATERFYVPASNSTTIGIGDPVNSTGDADSRGVAGIKRAAAGETLLGVVASIEVDGDNLSQAYLPASTAGYVNVIADPRVEFETKYNGTLTTANVGQLVDFAVTAVNTQTNQSDAQASGTPGTGPLRILGGPLREDCVFTDANPMIRVQIASHERDSAVTTGV